MIKTVLIAIFVVYMSIANYCRFKAALGLETTYCRVC
jgi:hypothetical protein